MTAKAIVSKYTFKQLTRLLRDIRKQGRAEYPIEVPQKKKMKKLFDCFNGGLFWDDFSNVKEVIESEVLNRVEDGNG